MLYLAISLLKLLYYHLWLCVVDVWFGCDDGGDFFLVEKGTCERY